MRYCLQNPYRVTSRSCIQFLIYKLNIWSFQRKLNIRFDIQFIVKKNYLFIIFTQIVYIFSCRITVFSTAHWDMRESEISKKSYDTQSLQNFSAIENNISLFNNMRNWSFLSCIIFLPPTWWWFGEYTYACPSFWTQ